MSIIQPFSLCLVLVQLFTFICLLENFCAQVEEYSFNTIFCHLRWPQDIRQQKGGREDRGTDMLRSRAMQRGREGKINDIWPRKTRGKSFTGHNQRSYPNSQNRPPTHNLAFQSKSSRVYTQLSSIGSTRKYCGKISDG